MPRSEYRIAWVATTAVNSETMTPRPSVKAKPLHARGGEDEEDERDQERDDVRVDDRRQALAVARDDRRGQTDLPARTSSLTRSKTTMFASAATPSVRIRPAMPGRVSVIGISLTSA